VTIKQLEQYAAQRKEAADLERRIRQLEDRARGRVSDTVKASLPEYPYTEHTVTVRGYPERTARHLAMTAGLLERQRAELARELAEIEAWIATVQDSRTRQLIRYHYLDGRSWASAAQAVYGHPCADVARMRVKRYCEENL